MFEEIWSSEQDLDRRLRSSEEYRIVLLVMEMASNTRR